MTTQPDSDIFFRQITGLGPYIIFIKIFEIITFLVENQAQEEKVNKFTQISINNESGPRKSRVLNDVTIWLYHAK